MLDDHVLFNVLLYKKMHGCNNDDKISIPRKTLTIIFTSLD